MPRFARVASAFAVVTLLGVASAAPATANPSHWSDAKRAAKCAQAPKLQARRQSRHDRLAARKLSSNPDAIAARQARLSKLQAALAAGAAGTPGC
jgi:hypothetical protein